MIRIAFVITGLSTGGAEAMLLKLLENIDRDHFEPYVISLTTLGDVGLRIKCLGVPVEALNMMTTKPDISAFVRLVRRLRTIAPDLVQTWMYHADLIGGLAARIAGVKTVVWALRNSNLSDRLIKKSTLFVVSVCARISFWLPRRILSCSVRAKEVHIAIGYVADKIQVIPNGFDLARFKPDHKARHAIRQELDLPLDAKLVGLIARFDPQKNHKGFIEAAASVKEMFPNVHFVLAGSQIDFKNCELVNAIRSYGIQSSVHLLGRRDDMPRLMASLDVLVSSSHGEAFPNVLGEAMACGVPCVVTDVGDSAEIVGDTGRVVQAGDMAGLARHVVEVLRLPAVDRSELGRKARERIESRYEISGVTRLYERFFFELMGYQKSCVA